MGRASKYPDELRERAVRMVAEVRPQYPSQWAAITAVAGMLGIGTPETLRTLLRPPANDEPQGRNLGRRKQMTYRSPDSRADRVRTGPRQITALGLCRTR